MHATHSLIQGPPRVGVEADLEFAGRVLSRLQVPTVPIQHALTSAAPAAGAPTLVVDGIRGFSDEELAQQIQRKRFTIAPVHALPEAATLSLLTDLLDSHLQQATTVSRWMTISEHTRSTARAARRPRPS